MDPLFEAGPADPQQAENTDSAAAANCRALNAEARLSEFRLGLVTGYEP